MSLTNIMFYFFALVAALSAISMIFVKNVFYGALLLIVCLLSVAGIYVLSFAEFVAVVQIIIYAGGILVVIIFGIMLTSRMAGKPLLVQHGNWFPGLLVSGVMFVLLITLLSQQSFMQPSLPPQPEKQIGNIGVGLMTDFVLPFEIAGVLLLAALIGASVVASTMKSNRE